jgi:hypothetical protein
VNKLKIVGILIGTLATLILGYVLYQTYSVNPRIIQAVLDNSDEKTAARVMLIKYSTDKLLPVNYLHKHGKYWAAADGRWWRDFREPGRSVSVIVKGSTVNVVGLAIEDNPQLVDEIFDELRPTAPRWVGAILVEFTPQTSP